ncbi:hypothetical protein MXB_485, partial [Myxobolus squamalis]
MARPNIFKECLVCHYFCHSRKKIFVKTLKFSIKVPDKHAVNCDSTQLNVSWTHVKYCDCESDLDDSDFGTSAYGKRSATLREINDDSSFNGSFFNRL